MKEIVNQELLGKSIAMEKVGERIKQICSENGQILKQINANLAECFIVVETDEEQFTLPYSTFNIVNQCFTF